jgi:hypothetical protein
MLGNSFKLETNAFWISLSFPDNHSINHDRNQALLVLATSAGAVLANFLLPSLSIPPKLANYVIA